MNSLIQRLKRTNTFKGESGFGFQYIIPPLKCEASEQGSRVNATSKISGKKSDRDMAAMFQGTATTTNAQIGAAINCYPMFLINTFSENFTIVVTMQNSI